MVVRDEAMEAVAQLTKLKSLNLAYSGATLATYVMTSLVRLLQPYRAPTCHSCMWSIVSSSKGAAVTGLHNLAREICSDRLDA